MTADKATPVMIGITGGRNLVSVEVDLCADPSNAFNTTVAQVLVHVRPADAKKHGGHKQAYEEALGLMSQFYKSIGK